MTIPPNPDGRLTRQVEDFADAVAPGATRPADALAGDPELRSLLRFRQKAIEALPRVSPNLARAWSSQVLAKEAGSPAALGSSRDNVERGTLLGRWFQLSKSTRWLGRAIALYAGILLGLWLAQMMASPDTFQTIPVQNVASSSPSSGK